MYVWLIVSSASLTISTCSCGYTAHYTINYLLNQWLSLLRCHHLHYSQYYWLLIYYTIQLPRFYYTHNQNTYYIWYIYIYDNLHESIVFGTDTSSFCFPYRFFSTKMSCNLSSSEWRFNRLKSLLFPIIGQKNLPTSSSLWVKNENIFNTIFVWKKLLFPNGPSLLLMSRITLRTTSIFQFSTLHFHAPCWDMVTAKKSHAVKVAISAHLFPTCTNVQIECCFISASPNVFTFVVDHHFFLI